MIYINMMTNDGLETIDEVETYKEAKYLLNEYRIAFQGQNLSVKMSQRSTDEWRDR